ncbi:MAG TPA: WhiB family transcriptional regulator [Frankiaceae bacterium]|nr:WhiB family transcriptional regulator [Frankiaceae bacterium]
MGSFASHSAAAPSISDGTKPYRTWVRRAACTGLSDTFEQPGRTTEALAVCARCPVLAECREWALHHAVAGVAGGLTATARQSWRRENRVPEPAVAVEDFLSIDVNIKDFANRFSRARPILAAVQQWTQNGESQRQIAARLGCTTRQVVRLRMIGRRLQA